MNASAVIVAAGSGERFGTPKQLAILAGVPLFLHSIRAFENAALPEIILVTSAELDREIRSILASDVNRAVKVIIGGKRRQDSVRNGVNASSISDDGIILVHDAARPLVTVDLIRSVYTAASTYGAAIAAHPLVDTIKQVRDGFITSTVSRDDLWCAETPQAARKNLFLDAFAAADAENKTVTDEAQLLELINFSVHIVRSMSENLKITYPSDLRKAELLLQGRV